jgi:hypothetical protein
MMLFYFSLIIFVNSALLPSWSNLLKIQTLIVGDVKKVEQNLRDLKDSQADITKPPKASCGLTFTREHVLDCFDKIADLNCDFKLSASELDEGRKNRLTYFERFVTFLKTSTEIIMNACDKNKDGFIDHHEFLVDYEGCLNNEDELCRVRDICYRELAKAHVCGR